jgi:hypothetical protein
MILTQLEVEKAGQVRRAHLKKGISTTGRIESMYILQVQYILNILVSWKCALYKELIIIIYTPHYYYPVIKSIL